MRSILIFLILVLASSSRGWAGAWTLPEGKAQSIVTFSYSFATDTFNDSGKPIRIEPFEKYEMRIFAEYGYTDWLTIVAQPELRFKSQGEEEADGLGRVDLGVRTRLWKNDHAVISVEGTVSAPGESDPLPPLNGGDTDWEMEARALYGRGFDIGWRHGFADLQLGYRHRFSDPADEIVLDATIGLDVTEHSFAMLQSFNRLSVGDAKGIYEKTLETKLVFSTVYRLNDLWSFQAGSQATAYGHNVLREQGFFASLWRQF